MHYHFIRDQVKMKEIKLEYTKSRDQIAKIFTKPLNSKVF